MKSHSIPSLLGIAAVLIAALVVAIAFGVATDSPTAQAQTMVDYDTDDDGLIEITKKEQLAVIDVSGTGRQGHGDEDFDAAFPNAAESMGCVDTNESGQPGPCKGYELMGDLTLSGEWTPIVQYGGIFDGNGNTISGLKINGTGQGEFGLFGTLSGSGEVRNVGLVSVNITVMTTENGDVKAGGLAGMNSGTVSNSYATGQISVTRGDGGDTSNAGGLVGENDSGATTTASYATVAVTVSMGSPNAGGLVGNNIGSLVATYATGDVSATASEGLDANAGGLAGSSGGTVMASYATGNATAKSSGTNGDANAGGLVGDGDGVITASYSTGVPTANADTGTANAGGLKGSGNNNAEDSYWDADASGIATTTATGVPTSTVALQAPTGYGTTTNPADIFATWNLALDSTTTTLSDPWDFGGSWQYPVLQYGNLDPADQRSQVTLVLTQATISEKGGKTTVTATQDREANLHTVLTVSVNSESVTLSDNTTLTIPAGSKASTGEVTITAVDNNDIADSATSTVAVSATVGQGGSDADNPDDATLTITDDDSLMPVLVKNVRVRTKETLAVVTWDALDGADGYTVEWTSRVSRGEANWSRSSSQEVSGTSTTVRRLVPGADYGFRVSATNMENSTSEDVVASTEGEDDGASPFATMTPTPTATPSAPPATPIPPTSMISTSRATTLMSSDGTVTLELPAGSRSAPYQVNFESEIGCTYPGAKADVTFACVTALIFDSEDMLETDVEFDAAPTITFRLSAEQVEALGGEFLLTKIHEMGGLMILTRASAGAGWTALAGTTLTFDDESGGAVLAGWPARVTSFTAAADQATYDTVQEMYGHLLPRDTLTPPTGGPSVPGIALLALLLGSVGLLAAGWVMTARRSGA